MMRGNAYASTTAAVEAHTVNLANLAGDGTGAIWDVGIALVRA